MHYLLSVIRFWLFHMNNHKLIFRLILLAIVPISLNAQELATEVLTIEELREIYTKSPEHWPTPFVDDGVEFQEIGLLPDVTFPPNNPFTIDKMKLGEMLFHDGRLSRSKQIACASCHDVDLAWADGRKKSFGHNRQQGKRNAPSIENIGFNKHFFWDGRAKTLEEQALMPIQDPVEMNFTLPELEQRLANINEYKAPFAKVFGSEKITAKKVAMALATFQRSITSRKSDFDYFMLASQQTSLNTQQRYPNKLSDQALLGLHLFRTKARCVNCHFGPTFSDQKFHNIGLTYYKRKHEDLGRYSVTNNPEDVGKFKTPSLRGVINTSPWIHNGLFGDLKGIINLYNAGGAHPRVDPEDPLSPKLSAHLTPLGLTNDEISALIAFLTSISAKPTRDPNTRH